MWVAWVAWVASAPRARRKARSRGFTLIELMVVVVIVGVMAALAMPSMRLATYERHAYDDAGSIMGLFREARTRSIARGAAVLIQMTSNGATDRGTFLMYEAVVGAGVNGPLTAAAPVSACKAPTVWPTPLPLPGAANANLTARYIDGVNLNGTPENDADIETQITLPPAATLVPSQYVCYTPLGRAYTSTVTPPLFATPNLNPIQVLVRRLAAGGSVTGGRSVIILPNGSARIFSHVGGP